MKKQREVLRPVLSHHASRIRRTTYWVGDKPVSLVYIPPLADEHPETINDELSRRVSHRTTPFRNLTTLPRPYVTLAEYPFDMVRLACRSEEHTSELQSLRHLVCRLLLEK